MAAEVTSVRVPSSTWNTVMPVEVSPGLVTTTDVLRARVAPAWATIHEVARSGLPRVAVAASRPDGSP